MNAILLTGYDKVRSGKCVRYVKNGFMSERELSEGGKSGNARHNDSIENVQKTTVAVETFLNEFHFLNDLVAIQLPVSTIHA